MELNMYRVKAKLIALPKCECGHNLFADHVKLGKMYTVYPQSITKAEGIVGCGMCRKDIIRGRMILTDHSSGERGWLPLDIFEVDEVPTKEVLC
jgi:hypothetical protein